MVVSSKTLAIVVVTYAAWSDLRQHRIPNWLTLPAVIIGLALWYFGSGIEGLKLSAAGMAAGFIVFLVPFALGGMGGGDVKLMAADGALVGWPLVIWVILLSCVAALFGAIAKAIWQGRFVRQLTSTWFIMKNTLMALALRRPVTEIKTDTKVQAAAYVPFGAAIAVGTLWAILLQYLIAEGFVSNLPYF